jgi:hypothetical protein
MNKRLRKKVQKAGACVVCGVPARMVAPKLYCRRHWWKWALEGGGLRRPRRRSRWLRSIR